MAPESRSNTIRESLLRQNEHSFANLFVAARSSSSRFFSASIFAFSPLMLCSFFCFDFLFTLLNQARFYPCQHSGEIADEAGFHLRRRSICSFISFVESLFGSPPYSRADRWRLCTHPRPKLRKGSSYQRRLSYRLSHSNVF